jgi:phosphate transport system substrate-binding protein
MMGFLGTACLVVLLTAAVLLAGCGSKTSSDGDSTKYSGNVKVSGSTTVLPLAQEAATGFMDANPDANVDVQGGGSSVGITQVKEGVVNIGTSSRDLKPEENADNSLVPTKIALDVIAIVVNPNVTVTNLTKQQTQDVFTGKITNWKDVGGADASIIVAVRDKASGTREMFDEKAMGSTKDKPVEPTASAIECNANGIMRETVASKPNSIGYLSLGYVNNKLKAVNLDGVVPSLANALNKSYPLSRYLYLITKGQPTGAVKGYIDYVLSDQFQNDVVATEYIPIKQAQ